MLGESDRASLGRLYRLPASFAPLERVRGLLYGRSAAACRGHFAAARPQEHPHLNVSPVAPIAPTTSAPHRWTKLTWAGLLALLTPLTLLVHGYHPFVEDGGIYAAGIFLRLDPSLFPHTAAFVRAPMHYSLFAAAMAALVRATHVPPAWMLLLAALGSTWLMLFAARQVLRRCVPSDAAQFGGVALLAAWWTLPVAGTSLVLMDPYVTARSFSTPLSLLAIAFALQSWDGERAWFCRRPFVLCFACLAAAAALHPLMVAYGAGFVLAVRLCLTPPRLRLIAVLALAVVAAGGLLQRLAPAESPAWLAAEITRYYWFLSQWQWFELLGLLGPMIILGWLAFRPPAPWTREARALCRASVAGGCLAVSVALLYARESASVHLVARLQPLRIFLLVYALMATLLGALAVYAATRAAARIRTPALRAMRKATPVLGIAAMACVMAFAQCQTFPQSLHLELPWRAADSPNPWVQAFLWARVNTLPDALFALPANYITTAGEDAQTFRAIALRDAIPDYSKDGGEAAIAGSLAEAWQAGAVAQHDVGQLTDGQRIVRLQPFHASWLLLHSADHTAFPCPYDNGTVKICRLIAKAPAG